MARTGLPLCSADDFVFLGFFSLPFAETGRFHLSGRSINIYQRYFIVTTLLSSVSLLYIIILFESLLVTICYMVTNYTVLDVFRTSAFYIFFFMAQIMVRYIWFINGGLLKDTLCIVLSNIFMDSDN